MYHKYLICIFSLCISTTSFMLHAHAEHDKARFVSNKGKDKGDCSNVLRPCASIAYAVTKAAKGDYVLVSSGHYVIENESDLFYLQSQLVPVKGGFNQFDHYQVQSPNNNPTTITGVPLDLVASLTRAGFKVITDKKEHTISEELKNKLNKINALREFQQDKPCVTGMADGSFPCKNMDLVAHVPLPSGVSGNDIWGHVDLNTGTEYALLGLSTGVAVYDLSQPSSPKKVGEVTGNRTTWRDIKVYQFFDDNLQAYRAYAYVSAESNDGITIIDLNNLPHSVNLANSNKTISSSHNVYISNVDYTLNTAVTGTTPQLQIVGSRNNSLNNRGSFVGYSLADPINPNIEHNNINKGPQFYTHDATSMVISDERAQRDCINASSTCSVMIDFNESEVHFWDVSNPNQASLLSTASYNDVSLDNMYVHSGWYSDNKRYVFIHDEFDETKGGLNTTVRIFDVTDLKNPTQVGTWTGPTPAIDHNGFVRGNRYYMSNYERGITVLDISDPKNPAEVGFFDTFPPSDNNSFNGAWGVYPYLPSGLILGSDINSGLYILRDNTRKNEKGQVSFEKNSIDSQRDKTLKIDVSKPDSLTDMTSIAYETIAGSARAGEHFEPISGRLTWAANDTSPKQININIKAASDEESAQSFFVRLFDPSNGVVLGKNHYQRINLEGKVNSGFASFTQSNTEVSENTGEVTITVTRSGGVSGQLKVAYETLEDSASIDDYTAIQGELFWEDGQNTSKELSISLTDDLLEEDNETFKLNLKNPETDEVLSQLEITILDDDSNQAPVVDAGPDIEQNSGASFVISSAKVSDPEGDELTYLWEQSAGNTVTMANTDTLELSVSIAQNFAAGDIEFKLTVTDVKGASTSDKMVVSVINQPESPTPSEPEPSKSGGSFGYILAILSLLILGRRKYSI